MTASSQHTVTQQSSDHLASARGLRVQIDQIPILHGVDADVREGQITVMLGRNGAGKTTTLRTIMGLNRATDGTVHYQNNDITHWPTFERARLGLGYVPENRAIFRDLTVANNLAIAEQRRGELNRREEYIHHLFPDLERLSQLPAGQLSGGQQQMLAIARVLVPENSLLLIDEPFEGLAPVIVEQLLLAFVEIAKERTILLVEQNFRAAAEIASDYILMAEGRSVGTGKTAELMHDQARLERFLGVRQ